ncbi:uncharacterized protein EAE98_001479 [Botrytis deweyae]|uniref:Uncharacterized protein n=1 Tax=Botrytis deweyae TaxID=2478750 RepID=A0ABQ7IXZ7_9HELO|nr:uncharacterized protein EAE98_001479 [Botrytis deweyae]KAF7937165.1 hypothetical protein EAE98_001479 [Botrytis deweyae]
MHLPTYPQNPKPHISTSDAATPATPATPSVLSIHSTRSIHPVRYHLPSPSTIHTANPTPPPTHKPSDLQILHAIQTLKQSSSQAVKQSSSQAVKQPSSQAVKQSSSQAVKQSSSQAVKH